MNPLLRPWATPTAMAAAAGVDWSAKKVRASVGYSEDMEMIPIKNGDFGDFPVRYVE